MYKSRDLTGDEWMLCNPTVIDYGHQPATSRIPQSDPVPTWQTKEVNQSLTQSTMQTAFGMGWPTQKSIQDSAVKQQLYNPFVEDDMEISDDERHSKTPKISSVRADKKTFTFAKSSNFSTSLPKKKLEITSGAAFYRGLILYIPPFEQIISTEKSSSAVKILFASFEFSFKTPMKIEIKQRPDNLSVTDATVIFQDQVIVQGPTWTQARHNEISVKALELLSETCYTIQAKEDYFRKCKLIDALEMKTLNLKKWEELSQKYPKLVEVTKESHIQKTISVFLDKHTSTGIYEDIICCNLSIDDVRNIKRVIDFFKLTMLPCCVTTNLRQNQGPCVVSIHKYTSAKKLLDILVESGGENDKFRLFPPDTFKDFYKLHQNYWDPVCNSKQNQILQSRTTLEEEELQSAIMKPYENIVAELFEKHKRFPIGKKQIVDSKKRQAGDDFMKETFKIDMEHSKKVAPVERMQLLLKYMEQLQEYGSRVLTSGQPEMIKIYHNAIENLRKDLDSCRQDIEKEQKEKEGNKSESHSSRSPLRRKSSPKTGRKSPNRRSQDYSRKRSVSPRKRPRSRSPRKYEQRKSDSPKRKLRSVSPRRRVRSRSPRSRPSRSTRYSPPRKPRSRSPTKRARSPSPARRPRSPKRTSPGPIRYPRSRSPPLSSYQENEIFESIFKHQFRMFVELLRRNRIDIENTPIERRNNFKEKVLKFKEQLNKFSKEAYDNRNKLGGYLDEIDICVEELRDQDQLIAGRPAPGDLPRNITPPSWMGYQETAVPQYVSYPYPGPTQPSYRMPFFL